MIQVIQHFYNSFQELNAHEMVSCYHDDIIFYDPAFGKLYGERAKNMWRMLCESQKSKDFKVIYSNIEADNYIGSAHWEAFYTFGKTGRKVHNKITASFEFKDGKIIKHTDHFNLQSWAKQAMGLKGFFLGGSVFFQRKLQNQTHKLLDNYKSRLG